MEHNSDTSTAENYDHQPEKPTEGNTGVGRSYECTFCKRGFTNAQALGGHMNMHRKDKAKAKKKNKEEPSFQMVKSDEISSVDQQIITSYCTPRVSYQVYFPSSNPSFQTGNCENSLSVWRPPHEHLKDYTDANLSLRIGLCPPVEDEEERDRDRNLLEGEVDLELRLGP